MSDEGPVFVECHRVVVHQDGYRFVARPCPDGISVVLTYEEWDNSKRMWAERQTVEVPGTMADAVGEAVRRVGEELPQTGEQA